MKKVALVFILAVIVPSLVLAWLAVRSLRDQQFLIERQQSLLYQGVADSLAKNVQDALTDQQRQFTTRVGSLLREHTQMETVKNFDALLHQDWPLAQIGFVVTLSGDLLSPAPGQSAAARKFAVENGGFLASRETVEVYANNRLGANPALNNAVQAPAAPNDSSYSDLNKKPTVNLKSASRSVIPQQSASISQKLEPDQQLQSKLASSEAEFRQLIGDDTEGALARFVDNKLSVLFWCRSPADAQLIFGAQLSLTRLVNALQPQIQIDPALREDICVALLDDIAKPVVLLPTGFHATWKRPFVATEIGELLPHWEIAVYLLDPSKLARSARSVELTLGLLIAVLVLAIGVGSWLIVSDLNRQLTLARQKTDFVSNVSHELKTPLTSIRMFSELLAEGRVTDPARQHSYLGIITAEAARLTRLINNVLDFARIERGEKKYNFQTCDLVTVAREIAENYRPHLEANGFKFECELPEQPCMVIGDRDALAQIMVNLLSNAEKYAGKQKEILLQVTTQHSALPTALSQDSALPTPHSALERLPAPHSFEVQVLDRGLGVPAGAEEKIFEKFYRAHDSLSSGIQGSGLGLTLARQIARAHGGDLIYHAREGGGSCFVLHLPAETQVRQQKTNDSRT